MARELGVGSSLDPQWDATGRWEYMEEWLPLLAYLFVNQDEAMSIVKARSAEEACRALAARTACPLVKSGKNGALVFENGKVRAVPVRQVQPVDTTGAGDSFDAGFLYARLEKNRELAEAAAFGNAVGARSCLFAGGTSARTTYQQAFEFLTRR
jgi:sugar/nucleoside kinase (ribokinase family)